MCTRYCFLVYLLAVGTALQTHKNNYCIELSIQTVWHTFLCIHVCTYTYMYVAYILKLIKIKSLIKINSLHSNTCMATHANQNKYAIKPPPLLLFSLKSSSLLQSLITSHLNSWSETAKHTHTNRPSNMERSFHAVDTSHPKLLMFGNHCRDIS